MPMRKSLSPSDTPPARDGQRVPRPQRARLTRLTCLPLLWWASTFCTPEGDARPPSRSPEPPISGAQPPRDAPPPPPRSAPAPSYPPPPVPPEAQAPPVSAELPFVSASGTQESAFGKVKRFATNARIQSAHGVVTTVETQATRIGVEILEQGGNAVDAAVAAAFALAVTHPSAGNLGGGGFMLIKKGERIHALDFREDSPQGLTLERFAALLRAGAKTGAAVGVPGTVAGLLEAHTQLGALPLGRVLLPAERLAREGYTLGARQASTIAWAQADLLRDSVARRVYFANGKPLRAGTKIPRPDLGLALERIRRNGRAGFYEGPTAQDLIRSLGADGFLTLADLARYRAEWRTPLSFKLWGNQVITMPPPSSGGAVLTQVLLMLQALEQEPQSPPVELTFHRFIEASRRAQVERRFFLLGPEQRDAGARTVELARVLDPQTWLGPHPIDDTRKTPSASLEPRFRAVEAELEHTTHLSVVDADGNAVSLTVTLSGSFGARIFTRETGFALNNSVASFSVIGTNQPAPGIRTMSSMAPTLILDGKRLLVLGSPGGDTIPSTVAGLIVTLLSGDESLDSAVARPRLHQGFAPDTVQTERSRPLPAPLVTALRARGHKVDGARHAQGDANIAAWDGSIASAVSDAREGGLAQGARTPSP